MDVETGLLGGAALVMFFIGVCSPSRPFLIFSVVYFMITECCTAAFHIDFGRCVDKDVRGYFFLYCITLASLLLGLIIAFLVILKNYTELMVKINEFVGFSE